jgi:hypothetical protein
MPVVQNFAELYTDTMKKIIKPVHLDFLEEG